MVIGFTSGVFDLFHIGHLNMLRNSKSMCDRLIVGVSTDELVSYKNKKAVIPHFERMEIIRACTYVDAVVPQENLDKYEMWKKLKYDIMFVGDDWYNNKRWEDIERKLEVVDVKIIYFPYTKGTSSTLINETINNLRER